MTIYEKHSRQHGRSRRSFLKSIAGGAAAGLLLPGLAQAKFTQPERWLRLFNLHTAETAVVAYWADGQYVDSGLDALDSFFRDHRNGEIYPMDPNLLDVVYLLSNLSGSKRHVEVVCGYRSPQTNEMLRSTTSGVAKHSYHLTGQAIDLYIPGVSLARLHQIAKSLRAGGVGYYPSSNFIHVDTGPVRYW
jgi:uncharacterized protein YcbK (DUF882 family)